jgi:sugar (pentulose or hexulose) kinase
VHSQLKSHNERTIVLDSGHAMLHANEETVNAAAYATTRADLIITIGSGTMTDGCKLDCYAAMRPIPKEIRVTGGAARSTALRQIFASVLNANIRSVSSEEAGAAGAAMIAAVQQKFFPDMESCANTWVAPYLGASTLPDPQLAKVYEKMFEQSVDVRNAMRPIWRGISSKI